MKSIRSSVAKLLSAYRRAANLRGVQANRKERERLKPEGRAAFQAAVNALGNRERNAWAKAGYPGLHAENPEGPRKFDLSHQIGKVA
jgi:hypothetical protein